MREKYKYLFLFSLLFNPLSAKPFFEKSVFRLRKFYLYKILPTCSVISGNWMRTQNEIYYFVETFLHFQKHRGHS